MSPSKRLRSGLSESVPVKRSPRLSGKPSISTTRGKSLSLRKARRGRKQSPQNTSSSLTASKDSKYSSDGLSFESITDDDDFLPDINLESPFKCREYAKNDIIWAPFKEVYWPAVVTSVALPKVRFIYINESSKDVYKKLAKDLIPFDDPDKNLELKKLGEKSYVEFAAAYEQVVKYLCKKKHNSDLDARRYLTFSCDVNDKIGQAKHSLFRLTGNLDCRSESPTDHSSEDEEENEKLAMELAENSEVASEEGGTPETKQQAEERARVEEILRELETVPSDMTVTVEQSEKMREEAVSMLQIIKSRDCDNHLMNIRKGKFPSSLHLEYSNDEELSGGLGPFTLFTDLTYELLSTLDKYCDKYDKPDYKIKVMLVEAIIFATVKLRSCSREEAHKLFKDTCRKVEVKE